MNTATKQALKVTPYEIGRYHVKSRSTDGLYLVDLNHIPEGSRKPRPWCSCWEFAKHGKCSEKADHVAAVREFVEGEKV